jgi:hypothetical protein
MDVMWYAVLTDEKVTTFETKEEAQAAYDGLDEVKVLAQYFYDVPCIILAESHPDECLFCGNMKSFCICE